MPQCDSSPSPRTAPTTVWFVTFFHPSTLHLVIPLSCSVLSFSGLVADFAVQNIARDHMETIKKEFPWISYGDLWTLGGVVAIQESGGPVIPWRPGRIDGFEHHVTPDGRLPDAAQAQDHLRAIFYRMGFNDQEIVALSGAHAMGRCHTDRSGFEGPWQFSPTTFSNEYFRLLYVFCPLPLLLLGSA